MAQANNRDISVAVSYHEATKHSYTSVRTDGHFLDWSNRPLPYKIYPGAGTLALPRELSLSATPTLSVLRQQSGSRREPLDLETLTRLLFCAGGLTKRANVGGEDYHFRAAASAGALYPVELYLLAGEIEGIQGGLYHFLPADLKLHGLRRGDWRPYLARCVASNTVHHASAVLIMTSIFWRSAWKYRARAYRYCFWDTGMIMANLLAAANADGLDTKIITAFNDGPIEELLEVDGEREGVICLVALGPTQVAQLLGGQTGERAIDSNTQETQILPSMELESIPLSAKEVVYEHLVKLQSASRLRTVEEAAELSRVLFEPSRPETVSGEITLHSAAENDAKGLGETILRRGSTRVFAREPIAADELGAIMATSNARASGDLAQLAETYLIVNAVEGLVPGVYYYRRGTGALELLKAGDFRAKAGYLCLEQQLGADCSALIIYMYDLQRTLDAFGNRGYRNVHLEAGLLGGRAYLASYSLGLGATGLTFYDDDTTAFLQPHLEKMSPALMIALGVPLSRSNET